MKILLVDSTYPINVRNKKILDSLRRIYGNDCELFVIAWNRDDRKIDRDNTITYRIYNSLAEYGNLWAKFQKLIGYYSFIKKENNEIRPDIVIASHWDMLFLSSLIKGTYQKLVYENLDIPTSASTSVLRVLALIEKVALRKTDAIIFASRFFSDLYKKYKGPKLIIENLPFKDIVQRNSVLNYNSDKLKVSFIGTVRYFEVMKLLIDASKDLPVEILFWGEGPDINKLKEYAEQSPAVKFFGKYEYKDIGDIYNSSDIIWAVYPSKDYNVKYAISNKFFESMVFKKPAVFAAGTKLGDYVIENKIGFTVDPYDASNIRALLDRFISNNIEVNSTQQKDDILFWEENEPVLKKIMDDLNAK